jgi:hypothetical protein
VAKKTRLPVLLAVVFGALAGCAGGDQPRPVGDDPRLLVSQVDARHGAFIQGELVYEASDRCLYLKVGDELNTVVWPRGTRPIIESGKRGVQVPGFGVVFEGQTFRGGGGAGRAEPAVDEQPLSGACVIPGATVTGIGEVTELLEPPAGSR